MFTKYTQEDKSMNPRKLRMLCVLMALCLLFLPVGQAMAQILNAQASGAVYVPITGTVVNVSGQTMGQFNGNFIINSFARASVNN